jgi:hypothetical protein
MKLSNLFLCGFFIISLPFYIINAQDIDSIGKENFLFVPSIIGGQVEASSLLFVSEYGALIDIDLFKKHSKVNYSFGARISFESYGYFEPGGPTDGGPFKDYCFYIIHSTRSEDFHFNLLCGISYHTRRSTFQRPDETLFRTGFEFRYNLSNKVIGILFKGSTSFGKRNTFVGLGIAFGYYE